MSCTIQYEFDKRDSLKSTKNYLIANNAINKYNSIIDFTKYINLVGSLNKKGFEEYKFKDKLIYASDRGKVVYFNKNLFSEIDRINEVLKTTPKDVVITNFLNETRLGIDKFGDSNTNFQLASIEGKIASEKTIRDLAARISDRIGIPYKIISDRSQEYKGKIENGVAYINLAYATLDTIFHEVAAHPIIRTIKNRNSITDDYIKNAKFGYKLDGLSENEINKKIEELKSQSKNQAQLYQNLLKELEYGVGKEVLDRIKRDYVFKNINFNKNDIDFSMYGINSINDLIGAKVTSDNLFGEKRYFIDIGDISTRLSVFLDESVFTKDEFIITQNDLKPKYTLEEQQEEAVVELLGLMTAEKLDAVKDGKLISLLKRLLKEMKQFIRNLLNSKEIYIENLPESNKQDLINSKLNEMLKSGKIKKEC